MALVLNEKEQEQRVVIDNGFRHIILNTEDEIAEYARDNELHGEDLENYFKFSYSKIQFLYLGDTEVTDDEGRTHTVAFGAVDDDKGGFFFMDIRISYATINIRPMTGDIVEIEVIAKKGEKYLKRGKRYERKANKYLSGVYPLEVLKNNESFKAMLVKVATAVDTMYEKQPHRELFIHGIKNLITRLETMKLPLLEDIETADVLDAPDEASDDCYDCEGIYTPE